MQFKPGLVLHTCNPSTKKKKEKEKEKSMQFGQLL
jgi:hypothetical protein